MQALVAMHPPQHQWVVQLRQNLDLKLSLLAFMVVVFVNLNLFQHILLRRIILQANKVRGAICSNSNAFQHLVSIHLNTI